MAVFEKLTCSKCGKDRLPGEYQPSKRSGKGRICCHCVAERSKIYNQRSFHRRVSLGSRGLLPGQGNQMTRSERRKARESKQELSRLSLMLYYAKTPIEKQDWSVIKSGDRLAGVTADIDQALKHLRSAEIAIEEEIQGIDLQLQPE